MRTVPAAFALLGALIATTAGMTEGVRATLADTVVIGAPMAPVTALAAAGHLAASGQSVTMIGGYTGTTGVGATLLTVAFFAAVATVLTLTVVIASTSTAVVRRSRRGERS